MTPIRTIRRRLPVEIAVWLERYGDDLPRAWRECPHADWLVHLALHAGVGRTTVVHAVGELVSAAIAARRVPDMRVNRALVVSLRWLGGRAGGTEAWAAGFSASDAAKTLADDRDAATASAAGYLAFACDEEADDGFYAHRAYAAAAAAQAAIALEAPTLAADVIRSYVPISAVLQRISEWPEPLPGHGFPDPIESTPNPFVR
ncbi:MAG: hypothetical protein KC619_22915 [Myxococcales bacterium]|nr:hypothetical protein [Myxococcales bacterium]